MKLHWKILGLFVAVIALLLISYILFGFPIACGSHGCIRQTDVATQQAYDSAFARSTNARDVSEQATLTTLVRRYLLTHTSTTSSVSLDDAARYRTDILHTTDAAAVRQLGFSSLEEYDTVVLVPFLTQEALMKQRAITSPSVLYKQLAQEQRIFLFKKGYVWDKANGEVVAK